jgi:Flp pilus assembly protein TadG
MTNSHRGHPRGQSLVELALLLPILLMMAGGATDLARVYQAQLTLESAVRNAAEYLATSSADATAASTDARRIVCTETSNIPGFTPGAAPNPTETCTAPSVTVTDFAISTTALGATTKSPIGSVKVAGAIRFSTLVPWPFLPAQLDLTADATFSVVRGR